MRLRGHAGFGVFGKLRIVRVSGVSMQPTLEPGDLLTVLVGAAGRTGDLVVATLPDGRGLGVKRVRFLEPDGGVFLERDSPRQGSDSWTFGAVPPAAVLGRVVARVWPHPTKF